MKTYLLNASLNPCCNGMRLMMIATSTNRTATMETTKAMAMRSVVSI